MLFNVFNTKLIHIIETLGSKTGMKSESFSKVTAENNGH